MSETRLEEVKQLLQRSKEDLMRRYGAVGVGVGNAADQTDGYAIVVYLKSAKDMPRAALTVESVPLKFVVTGEFKPLALGGT